MKTDSPCQKSLLSAFSNINIYLLLRENLVDLVNRLMHTGPNW